MVILLPEVLIKMTFLFIRAKSQSSWTTLECHKILNYLGKNNDVNIFAIIEYDS